MSRFIQSLESRTLFSADSTAAAALLADVKQVLSAAAIARADLPAAMKSATSGVSKITVDLRTSTTSDNRSSNAALLRNFKSDVLKTFGALRGDETALLVVGDSLSARAAADAKALLLHPTSTAIQARVAADENALSTTPAAKLATLQAAAQSHGIGTDLANLLTANVSNTALAADAVIFQNGGTVVVAISKVVTAAGTFDTAIGTLNTQVSSTTSGSTIPNLVGTYTGQVTDGSHNQGLPSNWTLDITTEGTDGSFSGNITTSQNGNTSNQTQSVTGSVQADGSFTLTVAQGGASLTGAASTNTLSGTFNDGIGGTGPFTLNKQ